MKYKVKKIKKFLTKNKKSFLKILYSTLIAYGLVNIMNNCGGTVYAKQVDDKNNYLEELIDGYVDKIEKSAAPNSIVACGNLEDKTGYYFKNRILYDEYGEVVDLSNDNHSLYFRGVNLNKNSLEKMNLNKSESSILFLSGSSLTNDCISSFPKTTKVLYLNRCNFLTDLSELPIYCPNLEMLCLDNTNLDNLDFIYELPNLKVLNAKESLCITEDIINYLKKNNIQTDVSNNDIAIQNKLEMIVKEIIDPSMGDEEKVKAICSYVLENIEYNMKYIDESNHEPISFAMETKEGVCISYSYVTNALLNLAGIECYRVDNMAHVWNLVNIDERYYYIDNSSIDLDLQGNISFNKILEFNNSYMFGPLTFSISNPSTSIADQFTIIPDSLKDDVLVSRQDIEILIKKCMDSEIIDLYLFRLFVMGWAFYQVVSNTQEILKYKKLSLSKYK